MSRRYSQLNLADRRRLYHFVERKLPIKEMARQLGRHRSTIYREIRRNTFHDRELPEYSGYFPTVADDIRKERRRRLRKLMRHPPLRELVIEQLKALWSPEQIAGRLLADGVSAVRVCTETIYRFIYGKEDYALELYQHLPEGRRKRRPRGSRKPRDGAFPATNRISQRPDFIGDRSQFGHWEGDLLIFERDLGNANLTSLVERKSRYTVMIKNPSRRSKPIMDKIIETSLPCQPLHGRALPLIEVRSSPLLGLWKMALARGAGFATPVRPGRKVRWKTPTSASAASCPAIPIYPLSASNNSSLSSII